VKGTDVKEALVRGHEVTAIVQHPEKLQPHAKLHSQKGDVYNAEDVARLLAGHDAVLSAFNPGWGNPDTYNLQVKGTRSIIDGVGKASFRGLLFVGGAGSLGVNPGVQALDQPGFPAEYKQGAPATREPLNLLRKESALD
jgi:putative NADH-flavin reductase